MPNFGLTMRRRENSLMDRGTTAVSTDASGHYYFESAYPLAQWLVMEAYNDLFYTTGVTYQADNQPEPTTVLGAGVDVSVLADHRPVRHAWTGASTPTTPRGTNGVDPQNGGIVGTVQLRHDPQRTRPAVCRRRGLAARRAGPAGRALRAGAV